MKKFDDLLRVMSSVILGVMVKDFETIRLNLIKFIDPLGDRLHYRTCAYFAAAVAAGLVVLLLRNLHGSARFDELIEKRGSPPFYEKKVLGRSFAFILAVAGLFGGPALAGHRLAYHLTQDYEVWKAAIPLFFTFVIYAFWDLFLWISEPEEESDLDGTNIRLCDVALNWLKIDAVVLLLGMAFVVYWMYLEWKNQSMPPSSMLGGFLLITIVVILSDYITNHRFYFPGPSDQEEKCRCKTPAE